MEEKLSFKLFKSKLPVLYVFSRGAVCMSMVFDCGIYDHTLILLTLMY